MTETLFGDKASVDARLKQRPSRLEIFAILLNVAFSCILLWARIYRDEAFWDFNNYLKAAQGDFSQYFYGYWLLPVFAALSQLPVWLSHGLWVFFSVASIYFACRVFGGNPLYVMTSFQLFYSLGFGQITGILVGSIALMYWAMVHEYWYLAGVGLMVAMTKYQLGIVPAFSILMLSGLTFKEWMRVLVIPFVVIVISLLLYGFWFLDVRERIASGLPNASASVSLWQWLGPIALTLWLPPLILPLARKDRVLMVLATCALALPYFQQADLLLLYVFPVGWVVLLGNLGYLFFVGGVGALQLLFVVPLIVYAKFFLAGIAPRTTAGNRARG